MTTSRQRARQRHRDGAGRYASVNPCYHCGCSAGLDYVSDRRTDREFNDEGLVLCRRCAAFLDALPDADALARLRAAQYGRCPQPVSAVRVAPVSVGPHGAWLDGIAAHNQGRPPLSCPHAEPKLRRAFRRGWISARRARGW